MTTKSINELREILETAVLKAAKYLVGVLEAGEKPIVNIKKDATLVLSFDLECERIISDALGSVLPVLTEEQEKSHLIHTTEKSYFLVDPLDGTTSCRRFLNMQGGQVGYGPLVGCVLEGKLVLAAFYHAPARTFFSATRAEGAWSVRLPRPETVPSFDQRVRIHAGECEKLARAGVLFHLSKGGESSIVQFLKSKDAVENIYRFGGFANDCVRLAQGFEQLMIQFAVKPWDLTASLFAHEAGLEVVFDPTAARTSFNEWVMQPNNPVIIVHKNIKDELFTLLDKNK